MNGVRAGLGLVWLELCLLMLAPAARAADVNPFAQFQPVWSNGQLVAAGVIVTDPPYLADNTGRTDASAAIQQSLTTGRPVTASSAAPGGASSLALDDDPRTMWQSAEGTGPHRLTVELTEPSRVTRWRVHNAGNFAPHMLNTAAATLLGSVDSATWFVMAAFEKNAEDWVDLPVTSDRAVRFVRLEVTQSQQPGTGSNSVRIAGFDVFGYPQSDVR